MGHYCWVCGGSRANEKFSGRGHARHICKDCQRLPHQERDAVQALRDIERLLGQRNISDKNISRLKSLLRSPNDEVNRKAELLLEVARIAPGRRRRGFILARQAPELLNRPIAVGLWLGPSVMQQPDDILDDSQDFVEPDEEDGMDLSSLFVEE